MPGNPCPAEGALIIQNADIAEQLRKTRFTENLIRLNGPEMQGFSEWLFEPGMLFRSRITWWKNGRTRKSLHEGLDICFYHDLAGGVCSLRSGTVIPAMLDGEILKSEPDFLGESLYIRINSHSREDHLYVIYGHVEPFSDVRAGMKYSAGEGIALLADTGLSQSSIPPHLHITIAVAPPSISPSELGWGMMWNPERVTLLDPLMAITGPFTVLSG